MGTFHQDKCELHGITVVVETTAAELYVGRCDDMDEREIVLMDVDHHRDGQDGRSTDEYLRRAAAFGVWKKFDRLSIPRSQVASVRPLGEVAVL